MSTYHYKLLRELGRGSAGVIHLALDVAEDRLVALKHLSREAVAKSPNAVARFRREAKILTRLSHPNLVRALRTGRSDGRPYFAMEYVEGRSLGSVLEDAPLELGRALRMAERVARALEYVHRHGVVHRDVKPSNIVLDAASTPRLVDFGLARDESEQDLELTASGIAVGTLRFSAPEQCGGRSREVDGRADVYSLGLVLATALTQHYPAVPQTMEDLRGRFEREYERLLNRALVPEDVIDVCRKATRQDAQRRYRSAADLAKDLHEVQRDVRASQRLAAAG